MEPVNVVVGIGLSLPANAVEQLESVDPRLRISQITAEHRPYLRTGGGDDPASAAQDLAAMLAEAEVLVATMDAPLDLRKRAPRLRWFHTAAAGVERYVNAGYLDWDIVFTNGSGPGAVPIAEFALMMMLMLAKNAPMYVRQQDETRWQRVPGRELRGMTIGIIGLGAIGGEIARLSKAFGCRIIGIRRSVGEARDNVDGADLLLPPRSLPRLLAESDFVVIAAPSTPETTALIDAEALRRMKSSAFLINIARGSLVDEPALIAALKAGEIAGAGLDVFATEPLPPDSELWQLKQVIITPHASFMGESLIPGQLELLKENLRRYLRGESLLNPVSKEHGY